MADDPLVDLIVRRSADVLERLGPAERADTYVVSFWVNDEADEPRLPVLRVGTNTESNVRATAPRAWDTAEARWNFAFWLQNDLATIGGTDDLQGKALIDELFESHGLAYADGDFSDEAMEVHDRMTAAFVDACLAAAGLLHEAAVRRVFGRDLPVLVHELEYYGVIAEQNLRCNSSELVEDFVRWIYSM